MSQQINKCFIINITQIFDWLATHVVIHVIKTCEYKHVILIVRLNYNITYSTNVYKVKMYYKQSIIANYKGTNIFSFCLKIGLVKVYFM